MPSESGMGPLHSYDPGTGCFDPQECIADAKAERMSLDLAFRWQRPAPWCKKKRVWLPRWLSFFLGVDLKLSLNGFNVNIFFVQWLYEYELYVANKQVLWIGGTYFKDL